MSIYNLFSLDRNSNPHVVETAGNRALNQLKHNKVRQWLNQNNITCTELELKTLVDNMREHVGASTSVLLDPGLKDCYDAWLKSSTKQDQTFAKARLSYMNSKTDAVKFGKGCFDMLPHAGTIQIQRTESPQRFEHSPKCRWCKNPFKEFITLQCKCTARIGHKHCANNFISEYKNKCPVCRTFLLQRQEISKYMYWSADNKFHIL